MNQHLDRLDSCAALIRQPVRELIRLCDVKLHRTLMIVSGWRSVQEQWLNYQKGRMFNRDSGSWEVEDLSIVVTNSIPGRSAHNVISRAGEPASMAVDLVPLKNDGTADWEPGEQFFDDLYRLSWQCGLDPLGDPVGAFLKYDKGHFEEPGWKLKIDLLGYIQPIAEVTPV